MEDESGRVEVGMIEASLKDTLCTGVVGGVEGRMTKEGDFEFIQFHYLSPISPSPFSPLAQGTYLCLVSGLGIGNTSDPLSYQLFLDFVKQHAGISRVCRCF